MELFEFKFYKSYIDIFDKLTDEDSGKLIKRMTSFYFRWEDIETDSVIVEIVFSQIKYTMEKSIQWKVTGAIRNRVPDTTRTTVPNRVPDTTRTTKDKDKDKDKEQDNVKDNVKEDILVINNNPENPYDIYAYLKKLPDTDRQYVTDDFIYYASKFWHKWGGNEMVDDVRKWLKQLQSIHGHTADEMRSIIFQWYTYWIGQPEKKRPKDCKASLSKNPFMKNKYGK